MQMNLDPQSHVYHPSPVPLPQRSAWLKYPWRCLFYIDLYTEVYILDDFSPSEHVSSSRQFRIGELLAVRHFVSNPRRLMLKWMQIEYTRGYRRCVTFLRFPNLQFKNGENPVRSETADELSFAVLIHTPDDFYF